MEQYAVHQETGQSMPLEGQQLIVSREWVVLMGQAKGVTDRHALFFPKEGSIYLSAWSGKTFYNNQELQLNEEVKLEHNAVIVFGAKRKGAVFIFKDMRQKDRLRDTQKLRTARFDFSVVKSVAEKMGRELFNKAPATLGKFAEYLLDFLFDKFRVNRGVVYKIEGQRWIPIRARAMSAKFIPPKHILSKVQETREPIRFVLPEAEETGDLSKSIVDSNVQSAICFPLLNQGEMIGVLYVDTQKSDVILSQDDLIILCTLMPGVSGYMNALLTYEGERLEADRLMASLLKQEEPTLPNYKLGAMLVNKGIGGIALGVQGKPGDFQFLFVSLRQKAKNNRDYVSQVAAFSGLLALHGQHKWSLREVVDLFAGYLKDKYPTLKVGFGVCSLQGDKILFAGQGDVGLVVKPPDRVAFISSPSDVPWTEGGEAVLPLDYQFQAGTFFALTDQDPQKICLLFDRIKNVERIKEDLKSYPGVVFCHIGERDEAKSH